jgi:DNA-binding NarL/FixJ family response regulator
MPVNIAIIDKNEIYRESLKTVLEQINDFRVVFSTGDCNCLKMPGNLPIWVMMLDDSFGKEQCQELVIEAEAKWKSIKTLILAMYKEELNMDFGNVPVILKSSGKMEFEKRIRKLTSNQNDEMTY